jgi:hypothetical protein
VYIETFRNCGMYGPTMYYKTAKLRVEEELGELKWIEHSIGGCGHYPSLSNNPCYSNVYAHPVVLPLFSLPGCGV